MKRHYDTVAHVRIPREISKVCALYSELALYIIQPNYVNDIVEILSG